jgi:multidrug efflux pump subunit AcrA (membrane-fusion protein)
VNQDSRGLRSSIVSFGVVAVLIVVFVWWAAVSQIVQSSHAQGQVIASARTQSVQAAIEGVVARVLVEEGQKVKAGQVLARLDHSQANASFQDTQAKVAALTAALVRLNAEVFGRPLLFPKEVRAYPNFVSNQTELFRRRQSAVNNELAALQKSLSLAEEELALNEPLLATGDIGKAEVIRLRRVVADLSGQILTKRSKYLQDAQAEMTKAEEDLSTQRQVLVERGSVLDRTEIHAPADGIVKNIQTTTPNAKVRAGDLILELVPTGGELIVEVKLRPADVASMRVGLPTSIKLDAYDYSIYGALRGKVKYLSPDSLSERTAQGEHIYYRVQIAIDQVQLEALNKARPDRRVEIQPGMTCVVDIETGYHSVLSYLTKPITKTLSESMRER